jgi:tetratricopeptide (TPR) repeat protein
LPFNLSVLPAAGDASFWLSSIGWTLIIAALIFSRRRRSPYLWFGAAWFLLFFLPPFMISDGLPYFLEHRLYLPLIGFLIMLGEIDWLKNLNWARRRVRAGAAIVLIFLALITFAHSRHFRNPSVFWTAAVQDSPSSPLAYRNLGVIEYLSGDFQSAAQDYRQALILNPAEPMAHNNLGVIHLAQKNFTAAAEEFERELAINPGYDKALLNLGDLAYADGDTAKAVIYWQAALRSNPENPEAAARLNNSGKPLR